MSESVQTDSIPMELLAQTLERFVDAAGRLTEVTALDIQPSMSGASVLRYTIRYTSGRQDGATSLMTKVVTRLLLSDPTQAAWVQHYIGLVTGDGIEA